MNEPASGRDQPTGRSRRARRHHIGRRRLAPDQRQTRDARQHQFVAAAALFAGTEPGQKYLAVPAPKPPLEPRLRKLHRDRRRLLRSVERPHRNSRPNTINRKPRMGQSGHYVERLV
jgi:hypothetical protein